MIRAVRILGRYVLNLLIAVDQLANAILLGDPDETISSRAAKRADLWHWRTLGRFLEAIDPGHMKRSLELDEGSRAVFHRAPAVDPFLDPDDGIASAAASVPARPGDVAELSFVPDRRGGGGRLEIGVHRPAHALPAARAWLLSDGGVVSVVIDGAGPRGST